jgi:hypothetical protein
LSEIEEMLEEAKAPGKFSIVDALRDRAYPTDMVEVFLDESIAFIAADIENAIKKIGEKMDKESEKKQIDALLKKQEEFLDKKDKLVKEMGGARYVFHLQGISEGLREDLWKKSVERYPIKHETDRNPLTGRVERTEIESPDRDKFFTSLLWEAHIKKIIDPQGDEQDGITFEEAVELRRALPLASIGKITEAIEKMRAATAVFMMTVDEDFLAKS